MTTLQTNTEAAELAYGPKQNERLTYRAAVVLVVLLAVEGLTLLAMDRLLRVHMFVGLMLIPPVLVKLSSTGYRFARYYLRSDAYRAKGPPQLGLRLLAPFLVASTVAMFATGVWLMLIGRRSGTVLEVHKVCFIVWAGFFVVHFLAYAPRVLRSLANRGRVRGSTGSTLLNVTLMSAVVLGVTSALLLLPEIRGWISLR
jgi:hypothetical protein